MKKCFALLFAMVLASIFVGCGHEHLWKGPTCIDPMLCSECGITEGIPLGHDWVEATCTEPRHCARCGEIEGLSLDHDWAEATCTEPRRCERCGETEGLSLNHEWLEATCLASKTCSVCGAIEGGPLGHDWIEATHETPKTCARCGETEGGILLYEAAPSFYDGYEYAEFSRFNSNASENGLGGTMIWLEGSYQNVNTLDQPEIMVGLQVFFALFDDLDGNTWLVELDANYYNSIEKYEELCNHTLLVFGSYEGYSGVYNAYWSPCQDHFRKNNREQIF